MRWRPGYPLYEAKVLDLNVDESEANLVYTLRFETDDKGELDDGDEKIVQELLLDRDGAEWSYHQPSVQ